MCECETAASIITKCLVLWLTLVTMMASTGGVRGQTFYATEATQNGKVPGRHQHLGLGVDGK